MVVPNHAMRRMIIEWREAQGRRQHVQLPADEPTASGGRGGRGGRGGPGRAAPAEALAAAVVGNKTRNKSLATFLVIEQR